MNNTDRAEQTARLEAKVSRLYALVSATGVDVELPATLAKQLNRELVRTEDAIARLHRAGR